MSPRYTNFYQHEGDGWWERRAFLRNWRKIYSDDRRWSPPYYPTLSKALQPGQIEHLERMRPQPIYLEAMPRAKPRSQRKGDSFSPPHAMLGAMMEEPVAATVILADPRRRDRSAYLALLHVVNDLESLQRLLDSVLELLWQMGISRMIGPTSLAPYHHSGVLQDHFNLTPPLHTPYNPPYLPELMNRSMHRLETTYLYHVDVPAATAPPERTDVEISRAGPTSHTSAFLSALESIYDDERSFPAPDRAELDFLLNWAGSTPLTTWIAHKDDRIVGAAILQPDISRSFQRAGGGANPLWRLWLNWRCRRPATTGRLLWAGLLPQFRGQGIGHAMWGHLMSDARSRGWSQLTVGPLPRDSAAARFLTKRGAVRKQSYVVYASSP